MHKRIGILGGLTPESTITYYMHIVHRYHELYGDHGYPETFINGVSFQKYEDWMNDEDWDSIEVALLTGLKTLKRAGVDFAVIATNTIPSFSISYRRRSICPLSVSLMPQPR